MTKMPWKVTIKDSAIEDLAWFGKKEGRLLLRETEKLLSADPTIISRKMKTLRPNKVADRELRLFGKYRILFNLYPKIMEVDIVLVGEKIGSSLFVRGEEYAVHNESDPIE
ncbi:MAG: hypothetical protein HY717_06305 [Planctomycetes bacterium]|nr:hypothetical protein [Planctomycetota bacterium]